MINYVQKHKAKKLQAGGDPSMQGAPMEQAPQGGGDPMMELMQAGMQALESQDCQMMGQVLAAFLDVLGGAMQEQQPAMAMGGPMMYKKGGKFVADEEAYKESDSKKVPKAYKGSRMKKKMMMGSKMKKK